METWFYCWREPKGEGRGCVISFFSVSGDNLSQTPSGRKLEDGHFCLGEGKWGMWLRGLEMGIKTKAVGSDHTHFLIAFLSAISCGTQEYKPQLALRAR